MSIAAGGQFQASRLTSEMGLTNSIGPHISLSAGKWLDVYKRQGETVRIFAFNTVASARDALKALETGGGGTLLYDADAVAGADGYYEIRVAENGALIFNMQRCV